MDSPIRDLMTVMIVDNEAHCRNAVRHFLEQSYPEVHIIGEAASLKAAIDLIQANPPDLLILDVALEDGTGFDLLDAFPEAAFQVVFVTAHDDFALRAFRYNAIDYLLKPFVQKDLTAAVKRAVRPFYPMDRTMQLQQLHPQDATDIFDRITLNIGTGLLFIQTNEISHIEANGNYSFVFLENGERHLVAQSLSAFEEILPSPPFFRAHQSHIVNIKFVRKLTKSDGDVLQMNDKSLITLARRRRDAFIKMMEYR